MSSSPPSTIGKYQIIREIARSNDIVYEAWDPLVNRRVAIKELNMPSGVTPQQKDDRISRFHREARAAGSLTHPNIMTIFEVGEDGGRYFIAMEYLDGQTLRNEIDNKGFLPVDRSIEIIGFVLNGLAFAHEKGVIHRDVKPDNVQILSDDRVKLTDFGIARLTFEPNLTQDGQVFGTPSYMSPEQIVGRDLDARSDLFSVGVMLYEMISGKKPFQGDSVVAITYSIMNRPPERPQQANFALWQVLERSMDKSPVMRYNSAHDMLQAIHEAQRAVGADGIINVTSPAGGNTLYQQAPYQGQASGGPLPPIVNPYAASGGYAPPAGFPQPGYNAPMPPAYSPAPPPTYVYDPYTSGAPPANPLLQGYLPPNAAPPPQPGFGAPQAPIYYPPPPRQPIFKPLDPETKYFIGRLFLGIIIFGAVVGLVVGVLSCAAKYTTNAANAPAPAGSPADRIHVLEAQYRVSPDDPNVKKQLAAAWRDQAAAQQSSNDVIDAADSLAQATQIEPNAQDDSELASLYESLAVKAADKKEQADRLTLAGQAWADAANHDLDGDRSVKEKNSAAHDYYAAAEADPGTDRTQHLDEALSLSSDDGLTANIKELEQKQGTPSP